MENNNVNIFQDDFEYTKKPEKYYIIKTAWILQVKVEAATEHKHYAMKVAGD
jgi:hypothetical protein